MSDDSHTDQQGLSGCHGVPVVRGGDDTYYICTRCGNVCELAKPPANQPPKDDQIAHREAIERVLWPVLIGPAEYKHGICENVRSVSVASLATAIGEAMKDEPESWVEGIIPKPPNRERIIIRNQVRAEIREAFKAIGLEIPE